MANQIEIELLAKAYAEEACPESGYDTQERRESEMDFCYQETKAAFKWLLERYTIVDKERVQSLWERYNNDEFISARADDKEYNQWCKGAKHALQSVFDEELFANVSEYYDREHEEDKVGG